MNTLHWTEWFIRLAFLATGIINLLPLAGLLGRPMLERTYGVSLGQGHDLTILMQHRALLFGLLACACFVGIFMRSWRMPLATAALISMLGFALIAALQPHGVAISKIMWIDIGASLLLAIGLLLHIKSSTAF